jgi:general nucleoside transport system permease protein
VAEESFLVSTIARSLASSTPLLLGALGAIYAERAGVVNLGMEGMMVLGALAAFGVSYQTGNPWLGLIVGGLVGMLAASIHAFISVTLRANQTVSGLALTMFGLGLSGLLGKSFQGVALNNILSAEGIRDSSLQNVSLPGLSGIPVIGPAFFSDQSPLTYIAIGLGVILWFVLFRTRLGIVIRSVGENPASADALGVNVARVRYASVIFGGLMAGLGGAFISVAYRPSWTEGTTAGVGWIALAIVVFAAWNPLNAIFAALFFGALTHLSFRLQSVVSSAELLTMLPYVSVVLALTINALRKGARTGAPESLGLPYQRGQR